MEARLLDRIKKQFNIYWAMYQLYGLDIISLT